MISASNLKAPPPAGVPSAPQYRCRFCRAPLRATFVDLGMSPLCQTHITAEMLNSAEAFYPLHAFVCEQCFLVQLPEFVAPADIFGEYAYFSSYSQSWVDHARRYADAMAERLGLDSKSRVMEIASNDGYLLQHFVARGIPVLGIEPAKNIAAVAVAKGVPTLVTFFGRTVAAEILKEFGQPLLLIGNNVLAHVPDLNDFVAGMKSLLAPGGVITMEFPHLRRLMTENQFDTIYHEHFSYFSFYTAERVFAHHGLTIFDVDEIPTHGGSLRIHARHHENSAIPVNARVPALLSREINEDVASLSGYEGFAERVQSTKRKLLAFLIEAKRAGKQIVGYGAPGKGNTLLNYCGIRSDFLDYTVDANPYKQGKFTPGTHIAIHPPARIRETKPDYVLILPWNLKDEIIETAAYVREWGGKFVVPIPEVAVIA
jgi:SAM-dependent methyltransferase